LNLLARQCCGHAARLAAVARISLDFARARAALRAEQFDWSRIGPKIAPIDAFLAAGGARGLITCPEQMLAALAGPRLPASLGNGAVRGASGRQTATRDPHASTLACQNRA
jgi:hypothetical protein